jgi:signal peptidase II
VKKLLLPLAIIIIIAAADQLTKIWAVANLTGKPPVSIFGDFIMGSLIFNEGGAMGTSFWSSTGYLIITLILLPFLFFYLYRYRETKILSLPLAFIIAGAIGNVIDRIRFGKVVDFIDMDIPDINLFGFHLDRWWTFNIADASISCALVFLIFLILFHKPKSASSPSITNLFSI